jgi:hypothetical protein
MIKIILNARLLSLLFMSAVAIFVSCKKEDVKSDKVELLSFGPTGAMHGDTLRFIGNNLDKVTEIDLTGSTVSKSAFLKQTPELILIIVPVETVKGFVTLKTPQGDIVSKTQLNLEVATEISSMTPQARPGEKITLKGNYLNWVTRITFANDKAVDSFVSKSLNELVVTVPLDAQTGPLVISYAGTEPKDVQTEDTLKVTLPKITSLTPNPVKHATNLSIKGTDLDLVKSIAFTGVDQPVTTFVSQSATEIVVKVPASTKKGKISVFAASGVSTESAQELDVILPVITRMTPNPIDPETNLTIDGTNLDLVSNVSFTGALSPVTTFVTQSATKIVVKVPKGTLKGKVTLGVLNSTLISESTDVLDIKGGLPPLADFALPIYTDGTQNGFQDWSYTDVHNFASTANVRQGTTSIKATYNATNGYQGVTLHNSDGVSTSGYSKIEVSIFGEAGTGGKKLNVVVNGNYSNPPQLTIVEGEWATFTVNFSTVGNPSKLTEVVFQSAGWGGTIHIDHVGLR